MSNSDYKKGIRCIICAAFCFALMNLFVKLAGDLPIWQKCFFRNFVAAIVVIGILIKKKEKVTVPKGNLRYIAIRCIAGTAGILLNFYAIGKMNIADASMLNKLSPFFCILLSIFFLKEKPTKTEWLAVFLAFTGALFVVKPSFRMECVPALAGFLGGFGAGLAYTCVRKMAMNHVKSDVIVLCFSIFSCVSVIPGFLVTYEPMKPIQLVYLACTGVAAAGGQFSITAAYSYAPAKEISVFDYTQVIFAAILSLLVFRDLPDVFSFIGYFIIIGAAVWKWCKGRKSEESAPDKND